MRMKGAQMMTSGDTSQQLTDEQGQAAVEFVFFFMAVVMMLMFIMTMFFFAQDFFQGITQARHDLLLDFRKTVPYKVDADTAYGKEIRLQLRKFPFMERFTFGVVPPVRNTRLVGGAEPPYTVPGAVECAAAAALVGIQTRTDNDTGPKAWAGAGIGAAACAVYAVW